MSSSTNLGFGSEVYVGFNEQSSRMVVAGSHGFSLFQVPPPGQFQLLRTEETLGAVSLVALIDTVPLVAVVPAATNRVLQIYDLKDKQVVSEIQFDTAILRVLLNISRLVVVLEAHIHVFDLNTMNSLAQLKVCPPNKRGLASLTGLTDRRECFLAFPSSVDMNAAAVSASGDGAPHGGGDVFLVELMDKQDVAPIPAHKSPIAALAFNATGTTLATCSEKGTVIRVFHNGPGYHLICTFRRGLNSAVIYNLAFTPNAEILTATSNSGTLHIFRCPTQRVNGETKAFKKISVRKTHTICAHSPMSGPHGNTSTLTVVHIPVPTRTGTGGGGVSASSGGSSGAAGGSTGFDAGGSGLVVQYTLEGDSLSDPREYKLGQ